MWGRDSPVCVSRCVCVFTSVTKCVLQSEHSVGARACVRASPCVKETPCVSGVVASVPKCMLPSTPRVSERPCVRGTACVRSLCVREMTVGMREHAASSPGVNVMKWCVSVVTRRCAWVECRRRRRQMRDKGRVAAVAILGTAPGLHGSERKARTVLRKRLPRARLRE